MGHTPSKGKMHEIVDEYAVAFGTYDSKLEFECPRCLKDKGDTDA